MNNVNVITTESTDIDRIFEGQKANQFVVGSTTVEDRIAKLRRLHEAFLMYRKQFQEVLAKDFGKHPTEVDLTEIYPVTSEIKHAIRHLSKWMGNNRRKTPLALLGASSRIKYEPKGVVLIIAPWNFPINLTFGPLVSAIAAGNCVVLKPSEMTPHTSAFMRTFIEDLFEKSEVAVVEGGVPTSEHLLSLPFNHIFFTGSPAVGKVVMRAAAQHLCSVTLELGGKSPTIVDETADVKLAAKRISWGKFTNSGQICIAPDYVLVHESKKEELVEELLKRLAPNKSVSPRSYSQVVNGRHYERLNGLLEDARIQGAQVMSAGEMAPEDNYLPPTLLTEVNEDARIMQEEIFGPLLPIMTFRSLDEVIQTVNSKERPLALYLYSHSKSNTKRIIAHTRAGGTCINHNGIQFFNLDLGFGGINNSGIGRGHGFEGFKAFSNPRGIMQQHIPNALDLLAPPYNDFKQKLIDFTIRWL